MKKFIIFLSLCSLPIVAMESNEKRLRITHEEIHMTHLNKQLLLAAQEGNCEKIQSLIQQGANIHSGEETPMITNNYDVHYFLTTPLYTAALNNQMDAFECLIQLGAHVNIDNIKMAILQNNEHITKLLFENCSSVDPNQELFHDTLLTYAASMGWKEICEKLIEDGADVNKPRSLESQSALMCASESGYDEICILLLNHGANINAQDNHGFCALSYALKESNITTTWLLLEHGANPNIRTNTGVTIFQDYFNSFYEYDEIVFGAFSLLLEYGANPNVSDPHGYTPLMSAAFFGYVDLIELFLQYNADHTLRNNIGHTALSMAEYEWEEVRNAHEHHMIADENILTHQNIVSLLSNPEAIQQVKTRRENNPAIQHNLTKFVTQYDKINICNALFQREINGIQKFSP